jgi:hypothetical protein
MFTMYFIHQILTNIINAEVYFVGYLYILDLINVRKMEHIKKSVWCFNLNKLLIGVICWKYDSTNHALNCANRTAPRSWQNSFASNITITPLPTARSVHTTDIKYVIDNNLLHFREGAEITSFNSETWWPLVNKLKTLVRNSVRKSQYCAPDSYQVRQHKTNFNYNRSLYFVCVGVPVYVYGLFSCVVSQTSAQNSHVVSDGAKVQATKNDNSASKNVTYGGH